MNDDKFVKYAPIFLLFTTEMLLYALGLSLASFSVLNILPSLNFGGLLRDRMFCIAIFGVCAVALGCYDVRRVADRFDIFYYMLLALALSLLIQLAVASVLPEGFRIITRREIIFSVPITVLLIMTWRRFSADWISRFQSAHRKFYITGDGTEGRRICDAIRQDEGAHAESVFLPFDSLKEEVTAILAKRTAGMDAPEDGQRAIQLPYEIIIVMPPKEPVALRRMLEFCELHFERAYLYPSLEDMLLFHQGNMLAVAGIPLIEVSKLGVTPAYAPVKRMMDIFAAVCGLTLASPICLITALLVKATSPGPVFYTQDRLGLHGKPFKIYKFRSMVSHIQLKNEAGHVPAAKDDARVTPVGKFIRKHRIDEIPQLYNVLIGDMSLIGPRPLWKEFYQSTEKELPLIEMRLMVRPGLSSLSHVLGSYTSDARDRLRYDFMYIDNINLLMDLRVAFETVRIVLSGKGAQ